MVIFILFKEQVSAFDYFVDSNKYFSIITCAFLNLFEAYRPAVWGRYVAYFSLTAI